MFENSLRSFESWYDRKCNMMLVIWDFCYRIFVGWDSSDEDILLLGGSYIVLGWGLDCFI